MSSSLLFLTGVISGIVAGLLVSKFYRRSRVLINSENNQVLKERLIALNDNLQNCLTALDLEREKSQKANESKIKAEEQLRSEKAQKDFLEKARSDLKTQFKALSGEMLDNSRESLLKSTKESISEPFSKEVIELKKQLVTMQKDSSEKLGALSETTKNLTQRSIDVQGAAEQLTFALRSPNIKGRWGEINLKRILEFVGLLNYCDFNEQVSLSTEEGSYRPDCLITIPGERKLIVDSKAPIESYLAAINEKEETKRNKFVTEHLRKVRGHIDQLSKKNYSEKFSSKGQVIDGVILFIPVEGALSMALEKDPDLLEYAFSKNIILTFPTSLLAILKGLAMTIQQAEISRNVEEVKNNALELNKRLIAFGEKFIAIGKNINTLNKSFNAAVGTYEKRLIPQGRRFSEMSGSVQELKLPEKIEGDAREPNIKNNLQ